MAGGPWLRLCLAAWLCTVAVGLPLPAPLRGPAPAGGERFPCEGCGCGCASAAQCWSGCCCHTLSERLAWARREGVRPPASVLAAARMQGLDTQIWTGGTSKGESKSSTPSTPSQCCAARPQSAAPRGCCAAVPTARRATVTSSTRGDCQGVCRQPERRSPVGARALSALKCRGLTTYWASVPTAPPAAAFCWAKGDSRERCIDAIVHRYFSAAAAPPTPPPERLV